MMHYTNSITNNTAIDYNNKNENKNNNRIEQYKYTQCTTQTALLSNTAIGYNNKNNNRIELYKYT